MRGSVDAWAIWDPYFRPPERATGARVLTDAQGLAPNRQFYLSRRGFTDTSPEIVDEVLKAIGEIDAWAAGHADTVAAELAPSVGIPAPVLAVALGRLSYGVAPSTRRPSPTSNGSRTRSTPSASCRSPSASRRGVDRAEEGCQPMSRASTLSRLNRAATPWLLPVTILLGWQAAVSTGLVSNRFMPAPLDVVRAGWDAARTGELWTNLGVSTLRALAGFAIGGSIGFALGLANGLSRVSETLTDTSVQ